VTPIDPDPTLADVVGWTPLSPADMVTFIRNVARVLDAVHAHGIAHLSLKPTNVFVGPAPSYNVRLVDFAMTIVRRALPAPDEIRPSDAWLAPEQVATGAPTGPGADIFACALLGFYALTGMSYWRAFQSESPDASVWRRELYGERVPVSKRAGELSVSLDGSLDAVFAQALSVSARERFQTAGAFAEALAVALETPGVVSATSTSAVVLAPSVLDVPPPPAQMEAVLAAFETAGSPAFQIADDRAERKPTEPPIAEAKPPEPFLARIRTGLTVPPPRDWSAALWTAAVVGGLAVAVAIIYPIVHRSAAAPESTASGSLPAAPVASVSVPATPPAATPSASPSAKPESKTVRSPTPARSSGATSGPSRKPCVKALKPCK
jgi:serine/threonine protein kinase